MTVVKSPSFLAASLFPDDYLDWVYIDASHRYEDVREDIAVWHRKVKPGGILSGHDYSNCAGVEKAVREFAASRACEAKLTDESINSWWFTLPIDKT